MNGLNKVLAAQMKRAFPLDMLLTLMFIPLLFLSAPFVRPHRVLGWHANLRRKLLFKGLNERYFAAMEPAAPPSVRMRHRLSSED